MSRSASRRLGFPALVLAACVLHVALAALAGPGFNSSDDEVYTRLAHDLATGQFELFPEHRSNRLGLIAPTALFYAVLGVGRFTTVLWPMLCSIAGIVGVALVARRLAGTSAGVVAAFLFAPLTIVVGGSAFLMPDCPVGVLMFLSAACLWRAREADGSAAAGWGAGSALLIALGVLTKLTVLWMAPLFAALFVRDVVRRQHGRAWAGFIVAGLLTGIAFFGSYAAATGDALYRVHAVSSQHNDTHWSYRDATTGALVGRLTYEPALMWARSLPELLLVLGLALCTLRRAGGDDERGAGTAFWAWYAAIVIGGFWLGTTSFARFAPLPLLPRMLAPAAAPLAVLAAAALTDVRTRTARSLPLIAVMLLGLVVAVTDGRMLVAGLYAGAGAAALLALRGIGRLRTCGLAAVVLVPLAMSAYSIARRALGESPAMRTERMLVPRLADHTTAAATILTDRRSERTVQFYRVYEPGTPRVVAWDGLTSLPPSDTPAFVYWHASRIAWRDGRTAPPDWLAELVKNGEIVWESDEARLVRIDR